MSRIFTDQERAKHNAAERARLEAHPAIAPYSVGASHGNFIFLKLPRAAEIAAQLKAHNIYIRVFAEFPDHLRVTIGTVDENQHFINAFVEISALRESV